jgi:polar amino acid transport system substrate-binding protein
MRFPSFVLSASLALATPAMATPPVTDALRAEFAPTGVLRAGTNVGNPVIVQQDPAGGEPRGVGPSLARELGKRLGVPVTYVVFETAGKMADAVKAGAWDIAMLAVDPARAEDIAFSAPYVLIEGTYLVPATSSFKSVDQFDKKGMRISVATKSAYDLYLSRHIKEAELVRFPTSQAAIDAFIEGKADAAAGVKQPLAATARANPKYRVIDGSFMTIGQASGVPKQRAASAAYLKAFIEEMKASGFVARALVDSGVADATVAPAAP